MHKLFWFALPGALALAVLTLQGGQAQSNCHPSYPTVCIPPPPPDLDCADVGYRNFPVRSGDPHRFDGDKDGIGCEGP
jgi:micrococcal nuclease